MLAVFAGVSVFGIFTTSGAANTSFSFLFLDY